jgi:hypothetical protein
MDKKTYEKSARKRENEYVPRAEEVPGSINRRPAAASLLLGGLTIFLAWWPSNNVPAMAARQPVFHLANHRDSTSQYGLLRSRIQAAVSPGVPLAVVIDVVYLSAIVVAS